MSLYRLSSLELVGYKTFASKTRFEFSGAITAIVGPNGSGKSNIADSIRWVLGEQAYSVLRGRKTEDMIFSGSEKRPKAGMASATVTFDNQDGWLPIDFSEVSITRRAYRDGQNEYLINQQKVRLRDVNELLAQSALAERTYTVIGQGLVDTALTLNSDERRRLFEEAAGIGLYRDRKEQALKRLKETRRNLDRVADIMAELKPRLRSLERQARRSEEFEVLRSDLRENLRTWYGYQWHQAQNELIGLRESAEAREEGLGLSRQKQSEITAEMNQARMAAQEMRIESNSLHRSLAELHAKREKSGRELAVATERKRALTDQRQAVEAERQRIRTEIESAKARTLEVQGEQERLREELDQNAARLEEARQKLSAEVSQQEATQGDQQAQLDALSEARASLLSLQQRQEDLASQMQARAAEQIELEKTVEEIAAKIAELQSQRQEMDGQAEAALEAERAREAELEVLHNDLSAQQAALSDLEERYSATLKRKGRYSVELQNLEQMQASASGFSEGARKVLADGAARGLTGAPQTLGASIQVQPEHEKAIAAALGDYLEAVVLQDPDQLASALALVEGDDLSLALVSASNSAPQPSNSQPQGRGILGPAATFINADDSLNTVLASILENILLVESRQDAAAQLRAGANGYSFVTLDGEFFSASGRAQVRSSVTVSPLAIPRQIEAARNGIAQTETELQDLEAQIEAAKAAVQKLESNLRAKREQLSDATSALEQLRREKQSLVLQSEQLERQGEWFQSQVRAAQIAEQKDQAQTEQFAAEKTRLESLVESSRQAVDGMEPLQAMPLDEQRAQVAHWEMRHALAERALQENQRRAEEHTEQISRAEAQMKSLEVREQELDSQEEQLQQEEQYLGGVEGDSDGEIETIQSRIGPTEEELAELESQLRQLQDAERELMERVTTSERNHTQAQIALARQQEALGTLRDRIEDDFGLVAFEYEEEVSGPTPLPLGELVEHLPVVASVEPELEERLKQQRAQIRRLGSINPEAKREYAAVKERFEDMTEQVADLEGAEENLKEVVAELDVLMEREFRNTFEVVASEFRKLFSRLFVGGSARILLTDEEDLTNSGIDIEARLPGKRTQRLALLSGGERSLTAAALVFALLKASPTPFCVMDEVDAMLDEANVGRFTEILRELSQKTQFVIITHNRNTVQVAEVIYGVTMGRDTASQVISLKLDEVDERYSAQ